MLVDGNVSGGTATILIIGYDLFSGSYSILATVTPDANGDWSAELPSGSAYYLAYIPDAETDVPQLHGMYSGDGVPA